jgi:hypothetical protein
MDDYASTANDSCRIRIISITALIVVNDIAGDSIPDLDSHTVAPITAREISIFRRQHESVIAGAVDPANAFVLSFASSNDEPVI